MSVGLPCYGCAYRAEIPGNIHSRCTYDWFNNLKDLSMFAGHEVPQRCQQWFSFPYNYDPVWGPNNCPVRNEVADPSKVEKPNSLTDLISLLSR